MKPNWLLTLGLAALVGVGVYFYKPQEAEMKLNFPYTMEVNPLAGMSCKAIVGSMMYGANNEIQKGITAELFKGTDKIAVELDEEDKFSFITGAAVEAGMAKSDDGWHVVRNDKKHLIAILAELEKPLRDSVNIFMLNKENGMAVWTKTRATNLGTDTPEGQSFLLQCS